MLCLALVARLRQLLGRARSHEPDRQSEQDRRQDKKDARLNRLKCPKPVSGMVELGVSDALVNQIVRKPLFAPQDLELVVKGVELRLAYPVAEGIDG